MSAWISSGKSEVVMAIYVLTHLFFAAVWIELTPAEKDSHRYLFPVIILACVPPLAWRAMRKKAGVAPPMLSAVRAHRAVVAVIFAVLLAVGALIPLVVV